MALSDLISKAAKTLKINSPEILTALGVSGVVTTAYLTAKASFKAEQMINADEAKGGVSSDRNQRIKERTKLVWKLYIPAGISGATTIACIIMASKSNSRRTTAAVTAYSLTERAFSEYRDKVVEQIGAGKEQKLRDDIVQERVARSHPESKEVIIVGTGHVLCCELYTNRYFRSDMETLRRAQNDINQKRLKELYVNLDEFYDLVGLPHTSNSDLVGWNFERQMELQFSTVLAEHGEPCLAFDYNYTKPLKE